MITLSRMCDGGGGNHSFCFLMVCRLATFRTPHPIFFFFLQRFVAVIDIRYCCYVPKLATVVPTQQTGWCVLSSACEGKGNVKSEGDSTQKLCERDEIATGWRGGCRNEGKEWNAMNHQKKKKI